MKKRTLLLRHVDDQRLQRLVALFPFATPHGVARRALLPGLDALDKGLGESVKVAR